MKNLAIEINNLTKKFNNTLAVKNVSFKVSKSNIIGLLGPNGCGKSTTIGMMLGLIKPSSGTVLINGKNKINKLSILLLDNIEVGSYLRNTYVLDKAKSREESLFEIYKILRPGEPPTLETAEVLFKKLALKVNWIASKNKITKEEAEDFYKIIGGSSGVEALDILTPYRFRIAIGKMFVDRDVMKTVRDCMVEHISGQSKDGEQK